MSFEERKNELVTKGLVQKFQTNEKVDDFIRGLIKDEKMQLVPILSKYCDVTSIITLLLDSLKEDLLSKEPQRERISDLSKLIYFIERNEKAEVSQELKEIFVEECTTQMHAIDFKEMNEL